MTGCFTAGFLTRVFTLPIGKSNPATNWEYQKLADETGGKMLQLRFH